MKFVYGTGRPRVIVIPIRRTIVMPGPYDDRGRGVGRELTEQGLPVGVSLRGSLVVVLDLGEVEGDVRRDVDRPGIARVDVAKSIGGAGIRPSPAALVYFPGRRRMAHLLYHPAWLPRFPAGRPSDRCRVQRIASMSTPDQNRGGRRPHGARANDAAPRARRRLLTGGGAHSDEVGRRPSPTTPHRPAGSPLPRPARRPRRVRGT